jgi:LysM repeat protein
MGLPAIPRLAGMAAAIAIAAVALFFLPALLGVGSDEEAGASPTPTTRPSSSIAPTPTPAPTPIIYIIKKGDFLNKVAAAHGITLEELMAANPDIKDPNKIVEGQRITIPSPSQAPPEDFGSSAEPSSGASP